MYVCGHVSAGRMHDAFRFARRSAGIQHEQRMFGIQRFRRTNAGHLGHHSRATTGRALDSCARASPVRLYTMTRSIDGVFAMRVIGILLQRNE